MKKFVLIALAVVLFVILFRFLVKLALVFALVGIVGYLIYQYGIKGKSRSY